MKKCGRIEKRKMEKMIKFKRKKVMERRIIEGLLSAQENK